MNFDQIPEVLSFGKYRGRAFSDVARRDPQYLDWLINTVDGPARTAAQLALAGQGVFDEVSKPKKGRKRKRRH